MVVNRNGSIERNDIVVLKCFFINILHTNLTRQLFCLCFIFTAKMTYCTNDISSLQLPLPQNPHRSGSVDKWPFKICHPSWSLILGLFNLFLHVLVILQIFCINWLFCINPSFALIELKLISFASHFSLLSSLSYNWHWLLTL